MKLLNNKLALAIAVLTASLAQPASAITIDDNYWGSDGHGWGDRIGNHTTTGGGYTFEVHNMDVSLTGNTLTVQVNTNYAGHAGLYGTGYGDLFLSSAWTPYGSAAGHYVNDDNITGTRWTYGFNLDGNRFDNSNMGGTGTLYEFTDTSANANNALLSDSQTVGTFRNGQEVIVKTANNTAISNGNWLISNNDADDYIRFEIDLTGTALLNSNTIALHWGMTCGNDTIEGAYQRVPEPAMLSLLALGLIGIGFTARKKGR